MSTNPTEEQTVYQRVHRSRKLARGLCGENGCRAETSRYRCERCAVLHAARERQRKARLWRAA